MKTVIVALCVLLALAACAQEQQPVVPDAPEQEPGLVPGAEARPSGPALAAEEPVAEPEAEAEPEKEEEPLPVLLNEGSCPLLSTKDVMEQCSRTAAPIVTSSERECLFRFDSGTLKVSAVDATVQEYQEWENTQGIYYTGELGENSARGEVKTVKQFGWFNGDQLIRAESTGVASCGGDRLDEIVGLIGGAPASKTKPPYKSVTYG